MGTWKSNPLLPSPSRSVAGSSSPLPRLARLRWNPPQSMNALTTSARAVFVEIHCRLELLDLRPAKLDYHHATMIADLERRLDRGYEFHLVPHTLLESYSVMTRMPDPFRKPPDPARALCRALPSTLPSQQPGSERRQKLGTPIAPGYTLNAITIRLHQLTTSLSGTSYGRLESAIRFVSTTTPHPTRK